MANPLNFTNARNYTEPVLTGGIDLNLVEIVRQVPSFIIGLLIFVFGVVVLSGMSSQRARTGYADAPLWVLMGSLSMFIVSLILSLKEGLMSLTTMGIVLGFLTFSAIWFFLSKGRGEL